MASSDTEKYNKLVYFVWWVADESRETRQIVSWSVDNSKFCEMCGKLGLDLSYETWVKNLGRDREEEVIDPFGLFETLAAALDEPDCSRFLARLTALQCGAISLNEFRSA